MIEQSGNIPQGLEGLVAMKEIRLPKSLRKYIRDLKAQGQWEEAMQVAQQTRKRKFQNQRREEKAREELDRSIFELLTTTDPKIEAEMEIRTIWLLNATGEIGSKEKSTELKLSLDTMAPQLQEFIEPRLVAIRDELSPLMPMPEPNFPRR